MSYSFSVRAATKAEAKEKVAVELAKVVQNQPIHSHDQVQAQTTADTLIDMVEDDETKDVSVAVNGSLSWNTLNEPQQFTGVNIGVSVYTPLKEAPKA